MELVLGPRLLAIAQLVPQDARLADIGSDHGYLPAWLLLQRQITSAIAGEINQDPARRSQETIDQYGLRDRMQVRLGSGLTVLKPGEVDVVTIAGMGGTTMVEILKASAHLLPSLSRLILQPNVAGADLRRWLVASGFAVADETLVKENDIVYEIIVAEPSDQPNQLDWLEAEFGPVLLRKKPALLNERLQEAIAGRQYVLTQLEKAKRIATNDKRQRLELEIARIEEVMKQ